jgi:hypothetical protein
MDAANNIATRINWDASRKYRFGKSETMDPATSRYNRIPKHLQMSQSLLFRFFLASAEA